MSPGDAWDDGVSVCTDDAWNGANSGVAVAFHDLPERWQASVVAKSTAQATYDPTRLALPLVLFRYSEDTFMAAREGLRIVLDRGGRESWGAIFVWSQFEGSATERLQSFFWFTRGTESNVLSWTWLPSQQ